VYLYKKRKFIIIYGVTCVKSPNGQSEEIKDYEEVDINEVVLGCIYTKKRKFITSY